MGLVLGNGLGRSPAVRRSLISGENRIQINTENGAYNVRKGFSVGETGPTRAWTTRKITLFAPKSTKNAQFLLKNCAFYYILFNFLLKWCRFYCDLVKIAFFSHANCVHFAKKFLCFFFILGVNHILIYTLHNIAV